MEREYVDFFQIVEIYRTNDSSKICYFLEKLYKVLIKINLAN